VTTPTSPSTSTSVDGELPAVVAQERLPHPNPYRCVHCTTDRATLRLILVDGRQVTTCRPHAARYPR